MENYQYSINTKVSNGQTQKYTYQPPYSPSYGWECPRCGRINAPWNDHCDCSRPTITTTEITCNSPLSGTITWDGVSTNIKPSTSVTQAKVAGTYTVNDNIHHTINNLNKEN